MNKINNPYLTFPIQRPFFTIIVSVIITAFLGIGTLWLNIDDDFVKMFPDNIQSKVVWDEIQEEFGSTEQLVIAFGHKNQTIITDKKAFATLKQFIKKLNELNDLIDYAISINNFSILDQENKYQSFSEYNEIQINNFMNQDRSYISIYIAPKVGENNAKLVKEVKI